MLSLEDNFADIIGKAQRGLGFSDTHLAEKARVNSQIIRKLREGEYDELAVLRIAPVLGLAPRALCELEYDVVALRDLMREDTRDEDWIHEAVRRGLVGVSGDWHILTRPKERQALRESGVRLFVLPRAFSNMTRLPQFEFLVSCWQRILDAAPTLEVGLAVSSHIRGRLVPQHWGAVEIRNRPIIFFHATEPMQFTLTLGFPTRQDEMAILEYHLPFAEAEMLAMTIEFLQQAHELKLDFSPRDGINLLRYAMKRLAQDPTHPVAKDAAWREALEKCLGADALDIRAAAKRR